MRIKRLRRANFFSAGGCNEAMELSAMLKYLAYFPTTLK
jgi:hypothetical protein